MLAVVRAIPLRLFELEFDSVEGRRQLGVIGEEVEDLLPEAVHVGRRAFAAVVGGASEVHYVENFAHVDQNVIFMHGVGAAQELAKRQADLDGVVSAVETMAADQRLRFEALEAALKREAAAGDEEKVKMEAEVRSQLVHEEERLEAEAAAEREAALMRQRLENASLAMEDGRARLRVADQDAAARDRHAAGLVLAEDSLKRQEALRRATDEAVLRQRLDDELRVEALRRVAELERVKAEAAARAATERENEDVRLRAMRAQAAEDRRKVLEAIAVAAGFFASGATTLIDDPKSLLTLVLAMIALVGGGFFAREAAILARSLAEAYFGRPRLVRETSRKRMATTKVVLHFLFRTLLYRGLVRGVPAFVFYRGPNKAYRRLRRVFSRALAKHRGALVAWEAGDLKRIAAEYALDLDKLAADQAYGAAKQAEFLHGVVLPEDLRERVLQLSIATRNAKTNRAPFRHMLLHGPPGTGKTLVARKLAAASGLEYALMSGGDVGPLGSEGVTALHALFRWARTSETGVLIFIDEAEAFLASRSRARLTEHMRNALNAFLYQTGSPTNSFVLVLATNRADDLDEAVLDRVDETLYFGLPAYEARLDLVKLYFEKYIGRLSDRRRRSLWARWTGPAALNIAADVDEPCLADVTATTHGFSGREIEKLFVAAQAIAYGSGAALDARTLRTVAQHKKAEHARKEAMLATPPIQEATLQAAPAYRARPNDDDETSSNSSHAQDVIKLVRPERLRYGVARDPFDATGRVLEQSFERADGVLSSTPASPASPETASPETAEAAEVARDDEVELVPADEGGFLPALRRKKKTRKST